MIKIISGVQHKVPWRILVFVVLCSPVLASALCAQTVRYVKQGGIGNGSSWTAASGDLQAMINESLPGNQVWVAAGTYNPIRPASNLTIIAPNDRLNAFVLKTDVKIYGGFSGTETSLEQRNWSANPTILSGDIGTTGNDSDNTCHVIISAGHVGTAEVNGFTIIGGRADRGTLSTINGYSLENSTGGAILNVFSSPGLTNIFITGNAAGTGGGMYNKASSFPTLINVTINGNVALVGSGGGMYNSSSSPALTNVTISGNRSVSGGGMYNVSSSPTLINVAINGNTAASGGGMSNISSSPILTNVTISGNIATSDGGGMFNNLSSSPKLTNVTICGNVATNNGPGMVNNSSFPVLKNCIVWNNTIFNLSSTPSYYYSLIQGSPANIANHNLNGMVTYANLFTNAAAGDYTLHPLSPAVNTGNNAYYAAGQSPDLSSITTDLAGNPRFYSSSIDMGAYESQIIPVTNIRYVKQGATGNGYSWALASGDLQAMINESRTGNQVWVAMGTYQPDMGQSFSMKEGVRIYGGFQDIGSPTIASRHWDLFRSILKGNNAPVIYNDNNALTNAAVLDGFTIRDGGETSFGAGMYNKNAYPMVLNCIFTANYAWTWGGGMYNEGPGSAVVVNTLFYNNQAAGGGGGVFNNLSNTSQFVNVTFTGNHSANGGGLHNYQRASTPLKNCILWGNTSDNAIGKQFYAATELPTPVLHSIVQGGSAGIGGIHTSTHLMDADPSFVDATVANYTLRSPSPAANAGNSVYYAAGESPNLSSITKDLAGKPRVFSVSVDIGAYEGPDTPLPLRLLSFDASAVEQNNIALTWRTTNEENTSHFEVQRSGNNPLTFSVIATVTASGNTQAEKRYNYIDQALAPGRYYYRLRTIDVDGSFTYSPVVTARLEYNRETSVSVYPIPTSNAVWLKGLVPGIDVELLDVQGRKLRQLHILQNPQQIELNELATGIYLIRLLNGKTLKVVRE